jgi:hypothetical protein
VGFFMPQTVFIQAFHFSTAAASVVLLLQKKNKATRKMSRDTIVMLSGWAGSGKDTVAQHLCASHQFVRVSFADHLKDRVAHDYQVDRSALDLREFKEQPLLHYPVLTTDPLSQYLGALMKLEFRTAEGKRDDGTSTLYWTPRAIAIVEGNLKRCVNPNHWVDRVCDHFQPGTSYVVSDWRFRHELHAIQLNCALKKLPHRIVTVRINRFAQCVSTDVSEHDLDQYPFEHVLDNRAPTLPALFQSMDDVLYAAAGPLPVADGVHCSHVGN